MGDGSRPKHAVLLRLALGSALLAAGCVAGNGPPPEAAAPPTSKGVSGVVTLREIDGGPAYYGRFRGSFPTDPAFFPIAVWSESVTVPEDTRLDKAAGINTYLELTADSDPGLIRAAGMYAVPSGPLRGSGSETVGRESADEIDMWAGAGEDSWTGRWGWDTDRNRQPCTESDHARGLACGYAAVRTLRARAPAGQPFFGSYGKGVMFWQSSEQGARFVNMVDTVIDDQFWYSNVAEEIGVPSQGGALLNYGQQMTNDEVHRASNYGAVVARLRALDATDGKRIPVWNFVEVGHPFAPAGWPTITPAQMNAAVWHSIIAGARGITYFNHSFGGHCPTQHILRDPCYAQMRTAVTATNARITRLAPVLNDSVAEGFLGVPAEVKAVAKYHDGDYYVIAGASGIGNGPQPVRMTIRCGDTTATVLDEDRTVQVRDGMLVDAFENTEAVHIYHIDGASCVQPTGSAKP